MADAQNPSNTPTPNESNQAETPHIPAPQLPVQGAMTASPLTGAGPHRGEAEKKPEHNVPKGPPQVPPSQPPRTKQSGPTQPRREQEGVGVPPQQQPPAPVPQTAMPAAPLQMFPQGMPQGIPDPAVASLLTQTLNNQRTQQQKFLLLVLAEDDWPRMLEFDDVNQLLAAIKERLGSNCHLFPFLGHRLTITEGPNRFLHTPYGPLPLFDIPEPTDAAETEYGWVGDPLDRPQAPATDSQEDDEDELPEDDESEVVQPGVPADAPAPVPEGETPMFDDDDPPG